MTLTPAWRTRVAAAAATAVAIVLGVQIAQGALFWPSLVAGLLAGIIVLTAQPRPLLALLLGGAALGYVVGNRGFAQISLTGAFPLLPGEFVLLAGGVILFVQSAWRRELPFRHDLLNLALMAWMAIGCLRIGFDVRVHGFAALRDFAVVYYAGFFFLAQHLARDATSARFVLRCVLAGCLALIAIHPLFGLFPEVFINSLTVRGIPVIFYKDDLVGNYMAAGALLCFIRWERGGPAAWLLPCLVLAGMMVATSSRSSMVALAAAAAWLALGRRWRFAGLLAGSGILAAFVLVLVAEWQNRSWRDTPLHRVYERVLSIADPQGRRSYATEDAFKGDNNIFRLVWWRAAIDETVETSPWFGLGFGHDLAGRFVQQYFPEGNDEFTARSPHNVLITIFARMGAIGFAVFLVVLGAVAVRTWKSVRAPPVAGAADDAWLAAWVLLVAACFGVVLEGPMGAVVFWTLLGLAHGAEQSAPRLESTPAADPHLRVPGPGREVATAS